MPAEIKVPTLGESVSSATVSRWIKRAGDAVAADEAVVELETDKVTVEVTAPEAGVIAEIAANEGAEVVPGDLLGTVDMKGVAANATKKDPAEAAAPKTGVNAQQEAPGPVARPGVGALPAAAKLMAEKNVKQEDLTGTAKDGRISKGDVLDFLNRPSAPAAASAVQAPRNSDAREERVKMTRLRKTIAARLKEAQNTAAMLTTFNEVDMSAIVSLRASYREVFEKKHKGIRLGFSGFFVKAVCAALAEFPAVNAEIDGDEIIYKNFVNMGVAVGGANGLVVPVIHDADQKSIAEIEAEIAGFAKRAQDGTLKLEELSGGSFSITNGGVYGSLMSTPIINPPQSGILGMHKIQDRPVAVDGKIEIRPMMYLALSYDHRIVDGREAVSFLVRVKESIEDPRRMLLAI
ncbi:2-oxoglutarate dehydrogenase complex dihydrolipoyllysine-residue succinyltransferase [Acidocella sp.]|uniref:2-oxoglutarate dehydrogenase complex dihydrolipoyllysine-residue succinyltransferase n=1 Tax=Acidocella sp. TaxID=50710 RepID=UPI00263494BE|nr:2-oxoglutarate dehydrogenase complex dihydrolipoyllysine-residue succinyltransferase [Acidocella sp.]